MWYQKLAQPLSIVHLMDAVFSVVCIEVCPQIQRDLVTSKYVS